MPLPTPDMRGEDAIWRQTAINTLQEALADFSGQTGAATSERQRVLWTVTRLWNCIPEDDEIWGAVNDVLVMREDLATK